LRSPGLDFFPEKDIVSAIICKTQQGNLHSGIIYRGSNSSINFLHLGWEDRLSNRWEWKILNASPNVEPERLESVAGLCRRIWNKFEKEKVFPYALRYLEPVAKLDGGDNKRNRPTKLKNPLKRKERSGRVFGMKKSKNTPPQPSAITYQGRSNLDKYQYIRKQIVCHVGSRRKSPVVGSERDVGLGEYREWIGEALAGSRKECRWRPWEKIRPEVLGKSNGINVVDEVGTARGRERTEVQCGIKVVCECGKPNRRIRERPCEHRQDVSSVGGGGTGGIESIGVEKGGRVGVYGQGDIEFRYDDTGSKDPISERTRDIEAGGVESETTVYASIKAWGREIQRGGTTGSTRSGNVIAQSKRTSVVCEDDGGKARVVEGDVRSERKDDDAGGGDADRSVQGDNKQSSEESGRKTARIARFYERVARADRKLDGHRASGNRKVAASRDDRSSVAHQRQTGKKSRIRFQMGDKSAERRVCIWTDVSWQTRGEPDARKGIDRLSRISANGRSAGDVHLRSRRVVERKCTNVTKEGSEEDRNTAKRTGWLVSRGSGPGHGEKYTRRNRRDDRYIENRRTQI
jgi:hypothetical protein